MRERTVWMITIMLLVWSALCLVALNATRSHAQHIIAPHPFTMSFLQTLPDTSQTRGQHCPRLSRHQPIRWKCPGICPAPNRLQPACLYANSCPPFNTSRRRQICDARARQKEPLRCEPLACSHSARDVEFALHVPKVNIGG